MLYELRLYTVVPGRLEDTLARFVDLPPIFSRSDIDNVGRWVSIAGPGAPGFIYLMAYRDFAERETQWASFYNDDAWWDHRALTNAGEEMTERFELLFLKPNAAWTPDPGLPGERIGGVHELIMVEVAVGQSAVANSYLASTWLPLMERAGAHVMMVADVISGAGLPKMAIMTAWSDADAWRLGRLRVDKDAANLEAIRAQRKERGRAAFGRVDSWLLDPTAFDLPLARLGNPRP